MIRSFANKATEALFNDIPVPRFRNIFKPARRKLMYLDQAADLNDLAVPPGNRLEALKGSRAGQFSIRVNSQWRLCFHWIEKNAWDVELVDYHRG